jgi:hypothetical protein
MGNLPGLIRVVENPSAKPYPNPLYSRIDMEEVTRHEKLIDAATSRYGLDPDLAKAVVWIETTHGWYDAITGLLKEPKSLRPMNVHVEFWRNLGITREQLANPRVNIETGVFILASLMQRIQDPTPEKLFSLYNNLATDKISPYGKTVAHYYVTKPWKTLRPDPGR